MESDRLYHAAEAANSAKETLVSLLTGALRRSVAPLEAAAELLHRLANDPTKAGEADAVVECCCDQLRQLAQNLGDCTNARENEIVFWSRPVSLERLLGVEAEER